MDVEVFKEVPQRGEGRSGVEVEAKFGDPEEAPATAFQIALAGKVVLVGVSSVPGVAVAFDGEAGRGARGDENDAGGPHPGMRDDAVAPGRPTGEDPLFAQGERGGHPPGARDGRGPAP